MSKTFTDEDDALLDELGVEIEEDDSGALTARQERIIAGFEDIQRFYETHGHAPRDNGLDIFERIYAVRLASIRASEECRNVLAGLDHQGLLNNGSDATAGPDDDDALLAELGLDVEDIDEAPNNLTTLRFVRSRAEREEAEEIATRNKCADFEQFKPLFDTMQRELTDGSRISQPFRKDAGFLKTDIAKGNFLILGGQIAYVAHIGEALKAPNGEYDARLRVIYSNGTESNLLLRSLQRALYKDDTSRLISEPSAGPLFGDVSAQNDQASGTIYVLRSKADLPIISANRELIHKIGVTSGTVEKRIAGAESQATFLFAGVDIVATYPLFNLSCAKLEAIIHRVFASARLDIEIMDRFGKPVIPREWFLVPLFVINEVMARISDGTIVDYEYDAGAAALTKIK
jgi:Meiotically up-regulated gene 113